MAGVGTSAFRHLETQFRRCCSSIWSKPFRWTGGVIIASVVAWASGQLNSFTQGVLPTYQELSCRAFIKSPHISPNEFTILVAQLDNDRELKDTSQVMEAFRGAGGFDVYPTCYPISISLRTDSKT